MRHPLVAMLCASLAACAPLPETPPPTVPPPPPCPVQASSGWVARIVAGEDGTQRQLSVSGTIVLPGPGWKTRWSPALQTTASNVVRVELDADFGEYSAGSAVNQDVARTWPIGFTPNTVIVQCRWVELTRVAPRVDGVR